jgi:hypothetical protein
MKEYPVLPPDAKKDEVTRRFGEILSVAQVHLPVRILARNLVENGFLVLRYEIRWAPEALRLCGRLYFVWNFNFADKIKSRVCNPRNGQSSEDSLTSSAYRRRAEHRETFA